MIPYGSLYPLQELAAPLRETIWMASALVAADLVLTGANDLEAAQHL
jgi:hypothetical protein